MRDNNGKIKWNGFWLRYLKRYCVYQFVENVGLLKRECVYESEWEKKVDRRWFFFS